MTVSNRTCCHRDEELVDLLLGNLDDGKQLEWQAHLSQCESCAKEAAHWSGLLMPRDGVAMQPPERLQRRIYRSLRLAAAWSRFRACLRPVYVAVSLAGVLLLVSFYPMSAGDPAGPAWHRAQSALSSLYAAEMADQAMVNHPKTVLHQAEPMVHAGSRGYVWINDVSNELLLMAEGLEPLAEKDYQVWLVINNNRSTAGVLQWRGRFAHLYFHGREIRSVEDIAVSIEPKGGSFVPTGPDALFVRIKHQ